MDYDSITNYNTNNSTMKIPKKASLIKKGDYIIIRGRPCKVIEVSISKTSKHGHSKYFVSFVDVETNLQLQSIFSSNDDIEIYGDDTLNYVI